MEKLRDATAAEGALFSSLWLIAKIRSLLKPRGSLCGLSRLELHPPDGLCLGVILIERVLAMQLTLFWHLLKTRSKENSNVVPAIEIEDKQESGSLLLEETSNA